LEKPICQRSYGASGSLCRSASFRMLCGKLNAKVEMRRSELRPI